MWRPLRHTDFRCHSLKPKATAANPLKSSFCGSLEQRKPELHSLPLCGPCVTTVRQVWEFSNGAGCNTRSRWWCWLKHFLSVCILNASRSKSNPVCATLVCSQTFPPLCFCQALLFWWEKKNRLNTIAGKDMLDVKTHRYSVMTIALHSVLNPCWFNNETDVCLHVKHNTISA